MHPFAALILAVAMLTARAAGAASAPDEALHAEHEAHGRTLLMHDGTRSLSQAVDAALAQGPGMRRVQARAREAEALAARGRGWISQAPSLELRTQTDRWQQATGVREHEAGLELPLWRWGERSAQQVQARQTQAQAQAERQLLHWQVAGAVREHYWAVIEAREQVHGAQDALQRFGQLEAEVLARIAAGDAAPLEHLTAEGQRRERQAALHEAEVAFADAAFAWRMLTGWDELPAALAETPAQGAAVPALLAARAELARAQAALAVARREGAGAPRLLIGARSEAADGEPAVDSLGASLSLPFGGAAQRVDLAVREQALAQRAYQAGESALAERLASELRAAEALRVHRLARVARDRAVARYNQAQGLLP